MSFPNHPFRTYQFNIGEYPYTLYFTKYDGKPAYDLYSYDDNYGKKLMTFHIHKDSGMFELRVGLFDGNGKTMARVHENKIIAKIFTIFEIPDEGNGWKNSNINFNN